MDIARDEYGIEVVERSIDRGELYSAEEIFFSGTASGICAVGGVDRRVVGDGTIGPVTKKLARLLQPHRHRPRTPLRLMALAHVRIGEGATPSG